MNHTHHTSKHLIIQTPMTGAINHGWAEDKLQQGRKQSAEHVSHLYQVAFITCVPSCTTLLIHMGRIVPSCTACSTIVNTHVPFCTRQVPHYITLSLQRHGNTAVESVVSPSQIICRGGHTHLGYVTAKSCKERRKRRMSSIYFLKCTCCILALSLR